jgi:hypothetical protein
MNQSASLLCALALLPLMLAACGGTGGTAGGGGSSTSSTGDTTSAGGGPALTPELQMAKFCADTTAPFCKALFACCTTDAQTLMTEGGTEAGCEAKMGDECKGQLTTAILPHLQAGDTALDQPALAACVARLDAMKGGGAACTRPAEFVFIYECFAALVGTLAPGAACDGNTLGDTSFIVCAKGDCKLDKCVPFLALGAPCQNPDIAAGGCDYVHGEYCQISAGKGTCAPVGKVGDKACDLDTSPGFSCYSATCDASLQCVAPTQDRLCKLL